MELGNGKELAFWNSNWLGINAFNNLFPNVFRTCNYSLAKIGYMGI